MRWLGLLRSSARVLLETSVFLGAYFAMFFQLSRKQTTVFANAYQGSPGFHMSVHAGTSLCNKAHYWLAMRSRRKPRA